jgi:cytochrome c-type biogenesis protein CcmF
MLGGYWAYGVLGWGGWWGWDPVENSSLLPWIVCVILLHTLLVQKKTGKLARTNFALAILSFTLVIYSTFLTRSGILGESSVHSFVDPGTFAYTLLVVWLFSAALIGGRMLQQRWKELSPAKQDDRLYNRESFIGLAALVMGVSALVIFFGTSLPIVSRTTVEPSFYNNSNLPLAVAMALLLGLSLLLRWGEGTRQDFFRRLWLPLAGSVTGQIVLWYFGLRNPSMIAFTFASLFVLFVNLVRGVQVVKENPRFVGGALAHLGLALLFLGIAGSGFYGQKETVSLAKGETKEILGYKMTYVDVQLTEQGKTKYVVRAERDGESVTLEPVMFQTSYNNSTMRNPDYISFLTKDLYLEPVSVEQSGQDLAHELVRLEKGVQTKIGDLEVRFVRFDMNAHGTDQMATDGGMTVGAVLDVKRKSSVEQVIPSANYGDGKQAQGKTVMMKDNKVGFQLVNMNIDMQTKKSTVDVVVFGLSEPATVVPAKEILVLEASVKPFINLVWLGTLCIIAGFFVAMLTRGKEVLVLSKKSSNGKSRKGSSRPGPDRKNEIQQEQSVQEEVTL